jgi:D-inositol-3-phosphate glycosyltransferase
VAELRLEPLPLRAGPWAGRRLAVISMHTSPTASLGHSANGGLNVYVREVCRLLGERGLDTDIFTHCPEGRSPGVEQLAPGARVIYLRAGPSRLDKYAMAAQVEEFAGRIHAFGAANGLAYDLLYSHYWLSGAAACTLHGRMRVPWVHTAHTLGFIKNQRLAGGDTPEPPMRLLLEAEISRSADVLVMNTEVEREAVVREHRVRLDRTLVVTPGVDLELFRLRDRDWCRAAIGHPGRKLVLFVGRLERLKGAEIAIRAFAEAVTDEPEALLLVIGDDSRPEGDSERERLAAVAAALGMSRRVDFLGSVAQEQLPLFYAAADACLMPSYSESFGLVGLEAQASGCPLITSSSAGLAAVARDGETGPLVTGDDPHDYARPLRRLLTDPDHAAQIRRRAARQAQGYSWSRTVDRLEALFERLLPQPGAQAGSLQE